MKNLFNKPLLVLFLGISLLFLSCNKEDENQSLNGNSKVTAYLKSFYKKDYHIGKSVESKAAKPTISADAKTIEYEDVILEEVFVGDDERARGYVVTSKETGEFLYFVDIDRENYKLTALDVLENEIRIKENINMLEEWATTNKLDLVKLLEEYNEEFNSGTSVQRKFWGWTGPRNVGGCDEGWQTTVNTHYILGIRDQIVYNEIPC